MDMPKHRFTFINPLQMKAVEDTKTLVVNVDGTVAFNGSPPHGQAHYHYDAATDCGNWVVEFHCRGDASKARTHIFKSIKGTACFFHQADDPAFNAIIIQH
jgi:spore germination cell wall hydrolase CwlJ-like protein